MAQAPMRVLSSQGDLVDSYDPALKKHRTVCFLAFDGRCYMCRAVKQVLERQAAGVLYRGEARQTLPPIGEGARTCARRRRLMARGARHWGRVPGPAAGQAGARDFLKLLKAKRAVLSAAERQKTFAGQGGKCALWAAGERRAPASWTVRQAFASSVQTLQTRAATATARRR